MNSRAADDRSYRFLDVMGILVVLQQSGRQIELMFIAMVSLAGSG
jgi:hypothetical protein